MIIVFEFELGNFVLAHGDLPGCYFVVAKAQGYFLNLITFVQPKLCSF
jgi:hypothetical protein